MSVFASYPLTGGGGGVPTYANLAAFPSAAGAGNGALAIALDSDILYESNGSAWIVLANPAYSGAITALTSDVTATGPGSVPATVAAIQGTTVSGTTGTTNVVFSASPTLVTPALGTPSAVVLTHGTGLPLTTGVTGVLPIANGGTNSSTALNNNRVIVSTSGAISEASAITANRALASDSSGLPVASSTTDTELGYVHGVTSAIQTQLNAITGSGVTSLTGDITGTGPGATATTIAKIQGTVVSGTTGSTNVVFSNSPTLVSPALGTPASGTLTSCTGLPLTTGVTGTLAIGNGGTGQTTAGPAFNALAPTTTKGDLIAYSTTNARLPVGSNGQVLTADSAQTLGVKWGASGTVSSVDVSGGATGLTTSGGPITTSGTITIAGTLAAASGGTGISSTATFPSSGTIAVLGTAQTFSAMQTFTSGLVIDSNINTADTNTSLLSTNNHFQIFTSFTSAREITLPSGSAGETWVLVNNQAFDMILKASGGNAFTIANSANYDGTVRNGFIIVQALQNSATAPAHWFILDLYDSGIFNCNVSQTNWGPFTLNFKWNRQNGKHQIAQTSGAAYGQAATGVLSGTMVISLNGSLPPRLYPSTTNVYAPVPVYTSNTQASNPGIASIGTSGDGSIYRDWAFNDIIGVNTNAAGPRFWTWNFSFND